MKRMSLYYEALFDGALFCGALFYGALELKPSKGRIVLFVMHVLKQK
jgi:hypothetical protein